MAAPAVSILQSLSQGLPLYHYGGDKHTPSDGGSYTSATIPPKVAITRDQTQRWSIKGQQYLQFQHTRVQNYQQINLGTLTSAQQTQVQDALAFSTRFLNNQDFIPEREGNISHKVEADVVRTAGLYLLHPVLQALWACPDYFKCFTSQAEDVKGATRTDITFYKLGGPNRPLRDFAVVEFKRRGVIDGNAFPHDNQLVMPTAHVNNRQAFLQQVLAPYVPNTPNTPNTQGPHLAWLAAKQALDEIERKNPRHKFTNSTEKLIKQAAAYSIQHRTRYVALFDYDFLVCCYFPWLDTTQSQQTLENNNRVLKEKYPVEVDIYPIQGQNGAANPDVRFALLGFLWDAMLNTV